MMRFLAISFFAILVLTSCSLKTTEGLRQIAFTKSEAKNVYFANPQIDYVYKAKIELYRKNFGGILIIKKLGVSDHRVVFTTEFGSTLFDFQFGEDSFTKHFVVDELDKKPIINLLKKDFRLLLKEKAEVETAFSSPQHLIYKTINGNGFNFYYFGKFTDSLEKIVSTSKTKEKFEIDFQSEKGKLAENIVIKHNDINLKIDLEKFKKE